MDLFDYMRETEMKKESPLASRMRPETLEEVVGQKHIIGRDRLLYRAIKADKLLVLMALYYAAAAAMQPVCDKRLVSCMSQTAAGHGMLLKIVGYSLALFAVTIAVLCISTNAAYYAA